MPRMSPGAKNMSNLSLTPPGCVVVARAGVATVVVVFLGAELIVDVVLLAKLGILGPFLGVPYWPSTSMGLGMVRGSEGIFSNVQHTSFSLE